MATSRKPLSAQRLAQVSDALLAARSAGQHNRPPGGLPRAFPAAEPASKRPPLEDERDPSPPAALESCTPGEIEEARRFLVRLGMIDPPPPRRSAA